MSSKSKVLALKYRPQVFKDLIGQKVITDTLINSLKLKKISNAYLFTGIRGVGKTTIARILAKSLNCKKAMRTAIKFFVLIFLMLASCDINTRLSTAELTELVQENIIDQWEEVYSEEEREEVEIKSLVLVHKSDNEYSGVLETIEYGQKYSYTVSVIYDGEYFSWEILD